MRTSPFIVALIGGIGSGKSTVAAEFARRGAAIIDGDVLGHEALREADVRDRITEAFGRDILDDSGDIDRRNLGAVVFATPQRKQQLEAIVHPRIRQKMHERIAEAGTRLVVIDAAVLLEAKWNDRVDRIVFVDAPEEVRLRRVLQRGWTEEQWRSREANQMPLTRKRENADYVIDNSTTPEQLGAQITDLMRAWNLDGSGSSPS